MSNESVKLLIELLNSTAPSITKSQSGLNISLKGSEFVIPTAAADAQSISKSVLFKR